MQTKKYPYTWEEAIEILRNHPEHKQIVYDAYLTTDLISNATRFERSAELQETIKLIKKFNPQAKTILDVPAGNGIATYAFSVNGFYVTAVEPDGGATLGREAIRFLLDKFGINAEIVNSFGENLPLENQTFDVVYVRQGLHHAMDLTKMISEYYRVLKSGGILVACREHVVDNKKESLQAFLDKQVDHQLYGGENAFTLNEYVEAMRKTKFEILAEIAPYDSPINLHPYTTKDLSDKILETNVGRLLSKFLPANIVSKIGFKVLKFSKRPGRLYSFVAKK